MSTFMAIAIGILIGVVLGGIGMFYLIQETQMDLSCDEESNHNKAESIKEKQYWVELENPFEVEELEMPKEVK